jgi:hypothetical protein
MRRTERATNEATSEATSNLTSNLTNELDTTPAPVGAALIELFARPATTNTERARQMDEAYSIIYAATPTTPASVMIDHAAQLIRAARRAAAHGATATAHTGAELIHAALTATAPDTMTTAAHPIDELSNRASSLLNKALDYIREYRAVLSA